MDVLDKALSPESKVKLVIKDGKIGLSGVLDTKGVDVELAVLVEADYFIDQLAEKIPGKLDDAILGVLKQALKAV